MTQMHQIGLVGNHNLNQLTCCKFKFCLGLNNHLFKFMAGKKPLPQLLTASAVRE